MKTQTSARAFFDTNVLIYAFATGDDRRHVAEALLLSGGTIGVQSLNEFVSVARRKFAMSWREVREATAAIERLCRSPHPLTMETHRSALDIAARYGYHIFDSLIIAAGLEAGCDTLYSEDLRNGQVINRLTIRNPFAVSG